MPTPLVEITGFRELEATIRNIAEDKQKKRVMLQVLRKVAGGTVRVARQQAPVSAKPHLVSGKRTRMMIPPGTLKKSIGVITGKSDNPTVLVGPRAKGSQKGFYGAWVELGHNIYRKGAKRKRAARFREYNNSLAMKRTPANPFMDRTYGLTRGQVTEETKAKVAEAIQRLIEKHQRR